MWIWLLFGMFFGAGSLIFPVSMGQLSRSNMWQTAVLAVFSLLCFAAGAFYQEFLEGHNTMNALAGLAFGIIVVNVIRDL